MKQELTEGSFGVLGRAPAAASSWAPLPPDRSRDFLGLGTRRFSLSSLLPTLPSSVAQGRPLCTSLFTRLSPFDGGDHDFSLRSGQCWARGQPGARGGSPWPLLSLTVPWTCVRAASRWPRWTPRLGERLPLSRRAAESAARPRGRAVLAHLSRRAPGAVACHCVDAFLPAGHDPLQLRVGGHESCGVDTRGWAASPGGALLPSDRVLWASRPHGRFPRSSR